MRVNYVEMALEGMETSSRKLVSELAFMVCRCGRINILIFAKITKF